MEKLKKKRLENEVDGPGPRSQSTNVNDDKNSHSAIKRRWLPPARASPLSGLRRSAPTPSRPRRHHPLRSLCPTGRRRSRPHRPELWATPNRQWTPPPPGPPTSSACRFPSRRAPQRVRMASPSGGPPPTRQPRCLPRGHRRHSYSGQGEHIKVLP